MSGRRDLDRRATAVMRLLRFLRKGAARPCEAARPGSVMLEMPEQGNIVVDRAALDAAIRDGLIRVENGAVRLTDAGCARNRRLTAGQDGHLQQHRLEETATVQLDGAPAEVVVNAAESPLFALYRRRDATGRPFLSRAEFQAGERLRADFTRGNLMPRITANWEAKVAGERRGGGIADLTDAALAARLRVEQAMNAVGPDLAGLLVDVCCFLKGLETVERERRWPQRSAKIVLRTALAALDRHYHPETASPRGRSILHWGSADYRPKVGAG